MGRNCLVFISATLLFVHLGGCIGGEVQWSRIGIDDDSVKNAAAAITKFVQEKGLLTSSGSSCNQITAEVTRALIKLAEGIGARFFLRMDFSATCGNDIVTKTCFPQVTMLIQNGTYPDHIKHLSNWVCYDT